MEESLLDTYIREGRHIFGICPNPECHQLSRLTDLGISYDSPYVKDWMDDTDGEIQSWEEKTEELKGKQKEMKLKAIADARQTELPLKLKSISSMFGEHMIQPDDIKVLCHPLDFVGFDGLITQASLKRIILLDHRTNSEFRNEIHQSVEATVSNGHYDWSVLRVDGDGAVTIE